MSVSICVPTFEQYGFGAKHVTDLLDSIVKQKGSFEVIISDNSANDEIFDVVKRYFDKFEIRYYKNPKRGISNNTNFAIDQARYDKIKPIYMDDILVGEYAIAEFSEALNRSAWAISDSYKITATGYKVKQKVPYWRDEVIQGFNSIGMPSVVAFRRNDIRFDPKLVTLLDCEFYWLLRERYGDPEFIRKPIVGQRYHENSTSSKQVNRRIEEFEYLKEKHPKIKSIFTE
jgi:hypothetical protein